METKQQKEALSYFTKQAKEWGDKARITTQDEVNIIQQRNDYVLRVIGKRDKTEITLDVGCGTGDLVHEIARRGIRAIGVDFAPEMIRIASDNAKRSKSKLAEFVCESIFDFDFRNRMFDVVSANGFIEYISFDQLNKFLEISFLLLKKGGSLVLGSRNRLFDAFSSNEFTSYEIIEGAINSILLESIALVKGMSMDKLAEMEPAPLPKVDQEQSNTGIDVSVRYQYTPVQLIRLLTEKGFEPVHVAPIHIHGVVPRFKDKFPAIHTIVSNLLQTYADENRELLPYASSFQIEARRS